MKNKRCQVILIYLHKSGRAGPRERMTSMTGIITVIDDQRKQAISCAVSLADYLLMERQNQGSKKTLIQASTSAS